MIAEFQRLTILDCVCDEHGNPLLSAEDWETVKRSNGKLIVSVGRSAGTQLREGGRRGKQIRRSGFRRERVELAIAIGCWPKRCRPPCTDRTRRRARHAGLLPRDSPPQGCDGNHAGRIARARRQRHTRRRAATGCNRRRIAVVGDQPHPLERHRRTDRRRVAEGHGHTYG